MASALRTVRARLWSLIGILHTSYDVCGHADLTRAHRQRSALIRLHVHSLYKVNKEERSVPDLSALGKLGWGEPVLEKISKIELSKLYYRLKTSYYPRGKLQTHAVVPDTSCILRYVM